jgi:hypothetical protein
MWFIDSTQIGSTSTKTKANLYLVGKQADPKYYGSLGNTFNYKAFAFTFDFYYNFGNYFNESAQAYAMDGAYSTRGKYAINLTRWQTQGTLQQYLNLYTTMQEAVRQDLIVHYIKAIMFV